MKDYIIAFGPYLLMAALGVTGYLARQLYTAVKSWQKEAEARMNEIEQKGNDGRRKLHDKVERQYGIVDGKLDALPERFVPRPELDEWRRGLDDRIDDITRGQGQIAKKIDDLHGAWTQFWKDQATRHN